MKLLVAALASAVAGSLFAGCTPAREPDLDTSTAARPTDGGWRRDGSLTRDSSVYDGGPRPDALAGDAVDGAVTLDAGAPPGCDFPLLGDDSAATPAPGIRAIVPGELYVVYSVLLQNGTRFETSNIFVLRGVDDVGAPLVWIFGTGYGDGAYLAQYPNRQAQSVERSGAADAADVDRIARCFGDPRTLGVRVLVPHGHADHFNDEFVQGLMALGYSWTNLTIHLHARDYEIATCTSCAHPADPPISPPVLDRVQLVGSSDSACDDPLMTLRSAALGTWTVTSDDERGHTAGVLNLDSEQLGVRLAGSKLQDYCTRATGSGAALRADPNYAYSRGGLLRCTVHEGLRAADFAESP